MIKKKIIIRDSRLKVFRSDIDDEQFLLEEINSINTNDVLAEEDDFILGNVKIIGAAYKGRNGRIYLLCKCNRCHGQDLYLLEEEIKSFNPDVDCNACCKATG